MTNAQVTALHEGLIGFLAVWGTILVPQLVLQLARYGRPRLRGLVTTAAVVFYACMALAVVFLPLPDANGARLEQTVQLRPFQWIADVHTELVKHGLPLSHWFLTQTFQQAAMNVLLFVPLGVFARVLWRRGFIGAMAVGGAVSLAIEITQLTANFGTAPFVYRIFDVDDLINNTVGAGVGWIFGALLLALRAMPSAIHAEPRGSQRVDLAETR
ncbi:MAG TPA: VanZ family protein [Amycolatopsis sp.]|jgi:glycopeptide antibiotics resistance protein|nr:VanZ family protein [Amycolatopsis sp.]